MGLVMECGSSVIARFASPSIVTSFLPNTAAGVPYSATLTAAGGVPRYTWSLISASPNTGSWISLSPSGILSGTPTTNEIENIVVKVTDLLGNSSTAGYPLLGVGFQLLGETLPTATLGQLYTQNISGRAVGGTPPYTFALVSYSPPTDVYTVSSAGVINGAPGGFTADSSAVTADSILTADSL